MTISVEDYIKTVYKQTVLHHADTKLSTIAGLLQVSNAAATDMARKLAAKGLVHYQKYKPLSLTDAGIELALQVIRKHRLWESFLYKTLNLTLHEIHREAEHLEHQTSDFLADKIEKYLGNPEFDPHGDPIPAFNANVEAVQQYVLLSEAAEGERFEIARLYSSEKEFFDFCSAHQLTVGSSIRVEKQYPSNKMTEIETDNSKILLNDIFSKVIYVKQV